MSSDFIISYMSFPSNNPVGDGTISDFLLTAWKMSSDFALTACKIARFVIKNN